MQNAIITNQSELFDIVLRFISQLKYHYIRLVNTKASVYGKWKRV